MEDNRILKVVYTFFLGLLLAIFVGVGIDTFYPGPTPPTYPTVLDAYGKNPTPELTKTQQEWDLKMSAYEKAVKPYNRNVSLIALGAAVILLAASIAFEKKIKFVADGVMLGGLFTLFYSLIRGFSSNNSKYVFVVITVGLIVVVYLGYRRFVKTHESVTVTKPPIDGQA